MHTLLFSLTLLAPASAPKIEPPTLSADGRFACSASAGEGVVVLDRHANPPKQTIVARSGSHAMISANGRFVVFQAPGKQSMKDQVWLVHLDPNGDGSFEDAKTLLITRDANDRSANPAICSDGRFVALATKATSLGEPGPGWKVCRYDTERREFSFAPIEAANLGGATGGRKSDTFSESYETPGGRVSVSGGATASSSGQSSGSAAGDGDTAPSVAISGDGMFLAFARDGRVFLWDMAAQSQRLVSRVGLAANPSMSADGRYLAYAINPGTKWEVYVYDKETGETRNASDPTGSLAPECSSGDGAGSSEQANVRKEVHRTENGISVSVSASSSSSSSSQRSSSGSAGDGEGLGPRTSISADGHFVAFDQRREVRVSDWQAGDVRTIDTNATQPFICGNAAWVSAVNGYGELIVFKR